MGDAAIGMTGMDIETAARNRIAILTMVFNNGVMGAERDVLKISDEKYGAMTVGGNYTKVAEGLNVAVAPRREARATSCGASRKRSTTTEKGAPFLLEFVVKEGHDFSRYNLPGLCALLSAPMRRLRYAVRGAWDAYLGLGSRSHIGCCRWRGPITSISGRFAGLDMVTHTREGIPGDPINVGLVGSQDDVLCAMHAAGWYPADPVTLRTSIAIVGSVLLDRPYRTAPVSPLFFQGRREELAFEKPIGNSADRRNHIRFWQVLQSGDEGRAVGSAPRPWTAVSASVTTPARSPITSRRTLTRSGLCLPPTW